MTKTLRFLAAVLLALATAASAQVGSPPGVGYPPFTSGGAFTGSLKGPTNCTLPAFSFTADTNAGLCLAAANSVRLQNNTTSSVSTSYVSLGTTQGSLVFNDGAAFDSQVRIYDDTVDMAAAGATQLTIAGATSMFTFGNTTTRDELILQPVAAGAGSFAGTFTSADLTGNRTWTAPDVAGQFLLAGATQTLVGNSTTKYTADGTNINVVLEMNPGASNFNFLAADNAATANGNSIQIDNSATPFINLTTYTAASTMEFNVYADRARFGDAGTHDFISVTPVVQGADPFTGTLTSSDLTGDQTWTFPDRTGTVLLSGAANAATTQTTFVTTGGGSISTMEVTPGNQVFWQHYTGAGVEPASEVRMTSTYARVRWEDVNGEYGQALGSAAYAALENRTVAAGSSLYTVAAATGAVLSNGTTVAANSLTIGIEAESLVDPMKFAPPVDGAASNTLTISTLDITADKTVYFPNTAGNVSVEAVEPITIPDNANGGTPATYTLDTVSSIVTFTCSDPQGCEVTMGETLATEGRSLTVVEVAAGAGNITLIHNGTTATLDAAGNVVFTGINDAVQLVYAGAIWRQIAPLYDAS